MATAYYCTEYIYTFPKGQSSDLVNISNLNKSILFYYNIKFLIAFINVSMNQHKRSVHFFNSKINNHTLSQYSNINFQGKSVKCYDFLMEHALIARMTD